jgi:hypothetical protein
MNQMDVPVRLEHIIDTAQLDHHLGEGTISQQKHPIYNLYIYNYTQKAVTVKEWDRTLSSCRGLIVNGAGEVLARPYAKFWNINDANHPETLAVNLPKQSAQIMEKMDGSLGIMYRYLDQVGIATRGSFDSEQARWATEWYKNHISTHSAVWPGEWTPLFEIIYQKNRIVCSYDFEGLVLTGLISIATGEEIPHSELEFWGRTNSIPVAPAYSHIPANDETKNREGYVLTWFDPYLKVKVKFEEYVRLHRIITGFNPKTVWEMLSEGKSDEIFKLETDTTLPKEFRDWLYYTRYGIEQDYRNIELVSRAIFSQRPGIAFSRKDNALHFKTFDGRYSAVLFAMLDGKDHAKVIWKMIKPKADKVFKVDGEA